jgi:hypothetical protein
MSSTLPLPERAALGLSADVIVGHDLATPG